MTHPNLEQLRDVIKKSNNRSRRKKSVIVFLSILILFIAYIIFSKPSYYQETVSFIKVSYENITTTEQIMIKSPNIVKMEPLPQLFVAVKSQAANVRREPNMNAYIIRVVHQLANLEYLNERIHDGERYWLKIKLEDGNAGWISVNIVHWSQESIERITENAQAGNVAAMKEIGEWLDYGIATDISLENSFAWYKLAADTGDHDSQFTIGRSYLEGHGVEQSYKKAAKYFQSSAEQGNAMAMNHLGYLYTYGLGVRENGQRAKQWLEKAIEYQSPDANANLAVLYLHGAKHFERNIEKGIELLQQAEATGNQEAKQVMDVYRNVSEEEFIRRMDTMRENIKEEDSSLWDYFLKLIFID